MIVWVVGDSMIVCVVGYSMMTRVVILIFQTVDDCMIVFQVIPLASFEGQSSDGRFVPVVPGGRTIPLTFANRGDYVSRVIQYRLHEMDLQVTPYSSLDAIIH